MEATEPAVSAKDLLRVRDVAAHIGVCERTVWSWIRLGRLRCLRIGKLVRIKPHDLATFLERHAVSAKSVTA